MHFGILGPLRVTAESRLVPLGGRNLRIVLAMLLCHPGQAVSTDTLTEAIWEQSPPRTSAKNIQVHVHRLRQLLGEERIVRQPHGYQIEVLRDELDATMFEDFATQGRDALVAGQPSLARSFFSRALELWRGPVLADLADVPRLRSAVVRWEELRLSTWEDRFESALALDAHHEIVAEVATLLAEHPLRERLRGQHMVALHRSGRPAEALQSYHDGRRILAEELGVDPSGTLQQLYLTIMRGQSPQPRTKEPSARRPVGQLPAGIPDFVGRLDMLAQMDSWASPGTPHAPLLLTGGAGMGKTALAVHWSWLHASAEGLEHLYINLRGYSGETPMPPLEALTYFLSGLGIAAELIPVDAVQAAGLYRSLLVDRRILIVLDNANTTEQVRPLLPGGTATRVIVTSRDRLSGLVARDGARRLELQKFTPQEALDLLTRISPTPISAAPAEDLALLCGHLPLALRVAAANLTDGRYASIAELVAEAAETAWPAGVELDDDVHSGTKIAFDHSYTRLGTAEQQLLRALSVVPGPGFSVSAAAALTSQSVTAALSQVHRLTGAHLIEQQAADQFSLHDLVRRYAATMSVNIDGPALRDRFRQALHEHYLHHGDRAARVAYPQILRLPRQSAATSPEEHAFPDADAAMRWLDAERANLIAAVEDAAGRDHHETVWVLADTLRGYFSIRRHVGDWLKTARLALHAAEQARHPAGQVSARLSLSMALWFLGQRQDAIDTLTPAVDLARGIGWFDAATSCLGNLGGIYGDWGKLTDAAACLAEALETHPHDGPLTTKASLLVNLGAVTHDIGHLTASITHHTAALAIFEQLDAPLSAARAEANLGESLLTMGDMEAARQRLDSALDKLKAEHDRYSEAAVLINLARLHRRHGDDARAAAFAARGLEMARAIDAKNHISAALSMIASLERDPVQHQHAIETARAGNSGYAEAEALSAAAQTEAAIGRLGNAAQLCRQAVTFSSAAGYRNLAAEALVQLAEVHEAQGLREQAALTAAQARALLDITGCKRFDDRLRPLIN
ncbi:DNA-binding SARP family transcriptional activator [Allocatelliglobosispora scoriae]|uniref:DNA-binding SARP family transcriptional activator n=1 Tax=Allocatelliglobosispora scoriae TaxID=643052 RepID=A0A841BIB5_9ACTN|nr:AfsR/SARP family transcriptional regulator [Allocatelliglobosispora scoriae]MBB5866641.1 DNA-binding SARP family transcriptional activator [Allocatelliglobosispora scoriae]